MKDIANYNHRIMVGVKDSNWSMTIETNASSVTPETSSINEYALTDYNQRIAAAVITVLISIFGLVGNCLVLFAVALSRKLRTKVNVFVVNLCVADGIICCVLPFSAVALLSESGWPLPQHVCTVAAYFFWIALGAGTVTLALIAFNRCYVIKHNNFRKVYTSKRIAFMILFAWLYPALLITTVISLGFGRLGYSEKYKSCGQDSTQPLSEYLSLFAGVVVFLPSLFVIISSYALIFVHVRNHHRLFIVDGSARNKSYREGNESFQEGNDSFQVGNEYFREGNETFRVDQERPVIPKDYESEAQTSLQIGFDNAASSSENPEGHDHTTSFSSYTNTAQSPISPSQFSSNYTEVTRSPISPSQFSASYHAPQSPTSPTPNYQDSRTGVPTTNEELGGAIRRTKTVTEELSSVMSRRQADITRNLFYVVCAFVFCLAPYGVAILLPDSDPSIPWVMLLLQFNTCVNPVIYALKHPTFRQVIPRILRCDFANIPEQAHWLKKLLGRH